MQLRKLTHNLLSLAVSDKYNPTIDIESKYTLLDLLETQANFVDHLNRYAYGVVLRNGLGIRAKSLQNPTIVDVEEDAIAASEA